MGLFSRISDLLRSNINDLISRAEDPEKLLNAAIKEMEEQIIEAKSRFAMSIADEKRLLKQRDSQLAKSQDWEKKAMAAIRAGRDDLAVEALAKKKEHEAASRQFEEQISIQKSAVDELKKALGELTSKLEDTRRRRTLLLARAQRASAQRKIAETLTAAGENSAIERLERLEAKVERAEAEAEATWEVASLSSGSYETELAKEIRLLGTGDVHDDLAELKDKMNAMGMLEEKARAALPSGEPETEAAPLDDGERERAARQAPTEVVDDDVSLVTEES